MKKIVASVGLVALGASGLQTAQAQGLLGPDASKPWSVALSLRGFYDDNVSTAPSNSGLDTETFGYEISPSFKLGWNLTQTTIQLGYTFTMKYYENRPVQHADKTDFTHQVNALVDHRFSERLSASISDSFVIGQEPDLLRAQNTLSGFQRISGDNIRNYGSLKVVGQITSTVGASVGYDNAYYNYDDDLFSASLDRMEHSIPLEAFLQLQPQTRVLVGYRFRDVGYDGDLFLDAPANTISSDQRNVRSHTGYAGIDHNLTQDLLLSARAGAQYSDYYNDPNSDNEVTPYVQASARYSYAQESYVELGVTYDRSATDLVGYDGNSFTTDAQSLVVYGSLNHKLGSKLYGSVTAQFQDSEYHGGSFDKTEELFFLAGVNLEYRFNQNFSANVGYNFDRLDSDAGRSFSRNRVYLGVTARY